MSATDEGTGFDTCAVCGESYEDYASLIAVGGGWCPHHDGPAHPTIQHAPIPTDTLTTLDTPEVDWAQAVSDALTAWDLERPRSQQTEMGVSGLGGCGRLASYLAHQTPPSDPKGSHPAAVLGTILHQEILPIMAAHHGGEHEVAIRVDGIPGHADLHVARTVVDLKTVGDYSWQRALREGQMTRQQRWQTTTYGKGLIDAGHPIDTIVIVYLHRETGETHYYAEPYDPDVAAEALDWYAWVAATDPTLVPRDERGPGLSVICDGCPFRSACWPDGPATIINEGGPAAIADMLGLYRDAADRIAAAKKDQEFARAALDGLQPGDYGTYALRWRKGRTTMDQKAARAELEAHDLPIPTTTSRPSIDVQRITP